MGRINSSLRWFEIFNIDLSDDVDLKNRDILELRDAIEKFSYSKNFGGKSYYHSSGR